VRKPECLRCAFGHQKLSIASIELIRRSENSIRCLGYVQDLCNTGYIELASSYDAIDFMIIEILTAPVVRFSIITCNPNTYFVIPDVNSNVYSNYNCITRQRRTSIVPWELI
jgi:hypothetical protein